MHRIGLVAAVALVGYVVGPTAARGDDLAKETCGAAFRLEQKSFKRLDARNAYVWVDDIESSVFRGYAPFQMSVVVGAAYPPLRAEAGRLERPAFDRLISSAYGVKRTNLTVSQAVVKSGAALSFSSGKQAYVLRVVSVNTSAGGQDAVMLKLCR